MSKNELISVCAWCKCRIGVDGSRLNAFAPAESNDLPGNRQISHGICRPCYEKQKKVIIENKRLRRRLWSQEAKR
jgi:hypothetical protein